MSNRMLYYVDLHFFSWLDETPNICRHYHNRMAEKTITATIAAIREPVLARRYTSRYLGESMMLGLTMSSKTTTQRCSRTGMDRPPPSSQNTNYDQKRSIAEQGSYRKLCQDKSLVLKDMDGREERRTTSRGAEAAFGICRYRSNDRQQAIQRRAQR